MLVELSVVEQRYHAVMEVLIAGVPVVEVAERYGVSRKTVHVWLNRYREGGLAGLADRSHRPHAHPAQVAAAVEVAICELRRAHPRWGPRRLLFELERQGCPGPVPSRSTVYRVLVRHGLVAAVPRKRRRQDYRRWERPAAMQLWQLDIMGSVFLASGQELKLVSGVDDHSRFCVIAKVVARATGRAVCQAFVEAMAVYGMPDEVLTDNGKQFTARFGRGSGEVLFDRICRKNGIAHRLTKPRSPTTTGKVERWQQSIQDELLAETGPFETIAEAQAAVDAWRDTYNRDRPHQSLGMAFPDQRFAARPLSAALPMWVPPQLQVATDPAPTPAPTPAPQPLPSSLRPPAIQPAEAPLGGDAVEVDRVVPGSGNLSLAGQQFWFGPQRAGAHVTLWMDTATVHVTVEGRHLKTLPSRLSTRDLARLRAEGARPAGPPPARPAAALAHGGPVEIDRTVNRSGVVAIGGIQVPIGAALAGRRVTLRLEGHSAHVITDGHLWRSVPLTLPPAKRARLQGARQPGPRPSPRPGPIRVQRRVSSRGGIQVIGQRIHVGMGHAGHTVTVEVDEHILRVLNDNDEALTVTARTSPAEPTRLKVYSRRTAT
jgi:transposase InsO family protein